LGLLISFWLNYLSALNLTLRAPKFVRLAVKNIAPACLTYLPFLIAICYFASGGRKYTFFRLKQQKLHEKFYSTENAKS
jgi:hypothetical protein